MTDAGLHIEIDEQYQPEVLPSVRIRLAWSGGVGATAVVAPQQVDRFLANGWELDPSDDVRARR